MEILHFTRINGAFIANSIERNIVTTVLGPRRVGKSYFMEEYRQGYPDRSWVFLNMDILSERERVIKQGLADLVAENAEQAIGGEKKLWVVIDEAQKCPELFEQIKVIYDENKGKDVIKFILTGSALLSLHQLSSESLAGRIELIFMNEFSLAEIARLNREKFPEGSLLDCLEPLNSLEESEISKKISVLDALKKMVEEKKPFKKILMEGLENTLVFGGFPEVLTIADEDKDQKLIYLKNYLQTYLEKDVRAIESITNLPLYRNLLDILAEQTGSLRDDGKIVSALSCSRETLKKYRSLVEATLLYQDVYPYIGKALKRLVKSPKGYLLNNGLVSVLTGLSDLRVLEKTGLIGHRLENWFLNELNIWGARSVMRQQIFFWQTNTQAEVDFVVERKPFLYPFEVTYQLEINPSKVRNLSRFLADEPKAKWGFYIYRGDFQINHELKIIFIPCWAVS
jgi:predicted AAA+ superfamily ATPase